MVNHEFGSELDMQIKFHFDDQVRRNYFLIYSKRKGGLKCKIFSICKIY